VARDLELLSRRGCHLCEDALTLLRAAGWRPVEVDIDLDLDLLAEYDHRVPVLRWSTTGEIVAEGVIGEDVLRLLADC
jgi:hypothetical protein